MKIYKISFSLLLFFAVFAGAQTQDSLVIGDFKNIPPSKLKTDAEGNKYYFDERLQARVYDVNGEKVIEMDELRLINKPRFNNQLDRNYYAFLNKKLVRVYPLFLEALQQYREIEEEMSRLSGNRRRQYVRQRQNLLADQYEAQMRDLTTSEGQVFAKLMNRATGKTVYDIIRELRGGWSAFWWNMKGNIAEVDLKKPYDPYRSREDEFIESLLLSNWNFGYLPTYPGYKDFVVKKN